MLCPSLLGIMVCLICLAGMSWAWFTAGVQSQSTITAGSYTLNETVKVKTSGTSADSADAAKTGALTKEADGTYALAENTQYVVTLKPSAAPKSGGYCDLCRSYSVPDWLLLLSASVLLPLLSVFLSVDCWLFLLFVVLWSELSFPEVPLLPAVDGSVTALLSVF